MIYKYLYYNTGCIVVGILYIWNIKKINKQCLTVIIIW